MSQAHVFSPSDLDMIIGTVFKERMVGESMMLIYDGDGVMVDPELPTEDPLHFKRITFKGAAIACVRINQCESRIVIFKPTSETHKLVAEFMDQEVFAQVEDTNGLFEPKGTQIINEMIYERGNDTMIISLEDVQ